MENQTKGMNEQTTGTTTEAGATAPEKAQNANASTTGCNETASQGDSRGRALSPELREKYLNNPYVKAINQVGDITYKPDFYKDMYGYIHYGQMTYVEAYEKLGFRVDELGENRALSAGKRAVKTQEAGEIRPGKYDGTIPLAEMNLEGKSDAEKIAMLKAHIFFLEAYQEAQKKTFFIPPHLKL